MVGRSHTAGMAADRDWYDSKCWDQSLRFDKWTKCHWSKTVVTSIYESSNSLHILGMQLLHGYTMNSSLHERQNYQGCEEVPKFDLTRAMRSSNG